jgi:zinc protease
VIPLVACAAAAAASSADLSALAARVTAAVPESGGVRLEAEGGSGPEVRAARFVYGNGLTLVVMRDASAPVVSVQTWIGVGSRHEEKGRTGLAHLFEHLMFKGTPRHPQGVFDRLMERAGAQTNAATWLDWTMYYANLPVSELDLALDLEADRLANLALDQAQLDSEREVVKNERSFRVDNDPDGALEEALFLSLFPHHPYGRPTLGSVADLDGLSVRDCLDFYRTWYSPGNVTLVIAGDLDFGDVLERVGHHFGPLKPVDLPRRDPPPEAEATDGPRVLQMRLPLAAERVRMGWRTEAATSPDLYALDVVNEVLFATESSRVHDRLVEAETVASDLDGLSEPLALDGVFLVDVFLNEGRPAEAAVEAVFQELERLSRRGPTKVELDRARNHLEAAFLRSLVTAGARATQLGAYQQVAGDFRRMFEFVDGIRGVTSADVRRVTGRLLTRARASVVIGRPL